MRIAFAFLAVILSAATAQGQGSIRGCATDKTGGVLPGVEITASTGERESKVVTDSSGCYQLKGLVAGTYTVRAALAGFVTGTHEGVSVVAGREAGPVDFALCLGELEEITWILPVDFNQAWKQADLVAHVRIASTGPVRSECPNHDFEHTATVMETFKAPAPRAPSETVTFVQENWVGERTAYPVGQEMVVFLTATSRGFVRLAGPHYVFLFGGDRVVGFHSPVETEGMTPASLLSALRALAKKAG